MHNVQTPLDTPVNEFGPTVVELNEQELAQVAGGSQIVNN
jgi:bacteriocin-like protein